MLSLGNRQMLGRRPQALGGHGYSREPVVLVPHRDPYELDEGDPHLSQSMYR